MARTRTPSDQKWLINERAVVVGELRATAAEQEHLAERKRFLTKALTSLDEVYSQLAPSAPQVTLPVVSGRTRFGGRGNFIAWLRTCLQAAYLNQLNQR